MIPLGSIVTVAEPFAVATGIPRKPGQLMEYEAGVGTTLAVVAITRSRRGDPLRGR